MMQNNTTPLGDVVDFSVEYSEGRVNPNVSEIEWDDDGADLLMSADGEDFIYGDGKGDGYGDDFFNADADNPDAYMPDNYKADGEDFYNTNGDEEYSNLTIWSKDKRKRFGKKVSKTVGKAKDKIQKGIAQGQKLLGNISEVERSVAPTGQMLGMAEQTPTTEPPKKKMSTGMIVGIVVGVVALGGLVYYLTREK